MPEVLDEAAPMRPTSRKGQIREAMELRMREAADRGMRALIVRAGDVFGGGRGTWFDLVIARDVNRGRVTYPGPLDAVHAWAYLPDLATAMVRLAERRATLGAFETFGFSGHAVSGREMIHAMARAMQRDLRVKRMRWWMVKTVGQLFAMGRELAEIEYLWRVPHRISGEELKSLIGELPHTPLDQAVAAALRKLGYSRSAQCVSPRDASRSRAPASARDPCPPRRAQFAVSAGSRPGGARRVRAAEPRRSGPWSRRR